jgi:hypothetical protein
MNYLLLISLAFLIFRFAAINKYGMLTLLGDLNTNWYEDDARAQTTHRYASFGPQVSVFYVSLLVFFTELTSIFIIYRF